ncbi:MAG: cysteine desulfurase family protein [Tissierellales bacterium]
MKVYLDNSSTTRPRDEVIEEIYHMLKVQYGNPSSLHRMGLEVEKRIESSRKIISDFIRCDKDEMFFTAGGTESNNLAIQGIVNKNIKRGDHIITTKFEHSSVLNTAKYYENKGLKVTYLDLDEYGMISLEQLENSISKDTILVTIMMVNNEIGTVLPINSISKIVRNKNRNTRIHVDGIQAFGKLDIDVTKLNIDTLSFSSHKVHGPKGVGGLYVKKDIILEPIIFGGNQERGIRSGTENIPGIIGLGKAVEILKDKYRQEAEDMQKLKSYFVRRLKDSIGNIRINSLLDERCAPHILNVSFMGVRGEVLLHYLEDNQVYISTASACSSHGKGKSHVLRSIGLKDDEIEGAIRFSFSHYNTSEEIDYAIGKLEQSVSDIRRITMR